MSDLKNVKMEGSKIPAEQIKNTALKEAIEKMQADGSKQNIDEMINRVIEAKLILPANVTPTTKAKTQNGRTVMEQATQVQFRLLENGNKEKFFGVFSDTEELEKWKGADSANKVVTDFDSLAQMVMDPAANVMGFVINAFGKSVTFPKNMVISIKHQKDYMKREKNKIKPNIPVQLGEPKEYPIELMGALINHFSTMPNVNRAFLRLMEQDGVKSYLVVVDFIGDLDSTFTSANEVAKKYLEEGQELTMMPYSIEFAQSAVRGVEPFYKKEN